MITQPDQVTGEPRTVSWFLPTKATRYPTRTATPPGQLPEALYRTAEGRWVLYALHRETDYTYTNEFVSDDTARAWLESHGYTDAAAEDAADSNDDRGPGRPTVGGRVAVSLGDDLLARVDAAAAADATTRAATLRRLLATALTVHDLRAADAAHTGEPRSPTLTDLENALDAVIDALGPEVVLALANHLIARRSPWPHRSPGGSPQICGHQYGDYYATVGHWLTDLADNSHDLGSAAVTEISHLAEVYHHAAETVGNREESP